MKFLLLILFFTAVATATMAQSTPISEAESNPKASAESLGQRLIGTLPLAAEGEFESPEAVAKAITEALIDDDWDRVIGATTIRLRCERVTFGATALDVGIVTPVASGDPSAPLAQFVAHIQNIQALRHIQLTLAGEPAPTKMRQLKIDRKSPDLEALNMLKESTLYKRPAGLRLLAAKIDSSLSKKTWELMQQRQSIKEVGAVEAAYVQVTLTGVPKVGESSIDYIILKIGTNWLVDTAFAR